MAGGHRLHQVERLAAAHLADDDPVRPHAQGGAEEVADGDLALPARIGRLRLQLHDVRALELQLAVVLDDDDALLLGGERGQRVEERGLARAGAAGDDDVLLGRDQHGQRLGGVVGERAEPDQALHGQGLAREAADGDLHALGRRRHDRLDARTVGQARLQDRALRPEGAAGVLGQVAQRRGQRLLRGELGRRAVDAPAALDEDVLVAVDHHLGHRRVVEVRGDRRQVAEDGLLEDLLRDHRRCLRRCRRGCRSACCSPSSDDFSQALAERAIAPSGSSSRKVRSSSAALSDSPSCWCAMASR